MLEIQCNLSPSVRENLAFNLILLLINAFKVILSSTNQQNNKCTSSHSLTWNPKVLFIAFQQNNCFCDFESRNSLSLRNLGKHLTIPNVAFLFALSKSIYNTTIIIIIRTNVITTSIITTDPPHTHTHKQKHSHNTNIVISINN